MPRRLAREVVMPQILVPTERRVRASHVSRRTALCGLASMGWSPVQAGDGFKVILPLQGQTPRGLSALVQPADGWLYGVIVAGGRRGRGLIYRCSTEGRFKELEMFGGSDVAGYSPGGLRLAPDGRLFGSTREGGLLGGGSVFTIDRAGVLTVLYQFAGGFDDLENGGTPLPARDGYLYGTTARGGDTGYGVFYRLSLDGEFKVLRSFLPNSNRPDWQLTEGSDGWFYTVTSLGGDFFNGSVMRLSPEGDMEQLYSFAADGHEGSTPKSPVLETADGSLVGSTVTQGPRGAGTVYSLGKDGVLTLLYSFDGSAELGGGPYGGLIEDASGRLYGVTANDPGTIFALKRGSGSALTLTTLHRFQTEDYDNGYRPLVQLLLADDGHLYGTTFIGGGIFRQKIR
jgi:uncharacterized repeat protein (TIGR03803 family)